MLTLVTDKRANGRRLVILVLEPQDIDHSKKGEPVSADSSKIEGHDILIAYAPDGERFRKMLATELPELNLPTFAQLLKAVQQYPEIRRPMKSGAGENLGKTLPISQGRLDQKQ